MAAEAQGKAVCLGANLAVEPPLVVAVVLDRPRPDVQRRVHREARRRHRPVFSIF